VVSQQVYSDFAAAQAAAKLLSAGQQAFVVPCPYNCVG